MLENGYTLSANGRQYTVIEQLGSGANTVAYLAECSHGELVTKCILKEYAPHSTDDFETGKARFIASGKMQNTIRQKTVLNNQTPPVSHVFEARLLLTLPAITEQRSTSSIRLHCPNIWNYA